MIKRKEFEFLAARIKKMTGEKPKMKFHRWSRTGKPYINFVQEWWKCKWRVYYE